MAVRRHATGGGHQAFGLVGPPPDRILEPVPWRPRRARSLRATSRPKLTPSRGSGAIRPRAALVRASPGRDPLIRSRARWQSGPSRTRPGSPPFRCPDDAIGRAHTRREDLARLPVPRGGGHDRLAVGREPRSGDEAPTEGQGRALRLRRIAVAPRLQPQPAKNASTARPATSSAAAPSAAGVSRTGARPAPRPRAPRPRGLVANRGEVAREIPGRPVAILGILREASSTMPGDARRQSWGRPRAAAEARPR